jgi:hypothetical protein
MIANPFINIRADPSTSFRTSSVKFTYDGITFRIENSPPYRFNGNVGSNYNSWTPALGEHTIVATPYSEDGARGTAGPSATVRFTVVSASGPAPVSPPTAPPVAPPSALPVSPPTIAPVSPPVVPPDAIPTPTDSPTTMTLVDALADIDVGPFSDGLTINLSDYPLISIRANPSTSFKTESVKFTYDGTTFRVENRSPYSFNGNTGSDYKEWTPSLGEHTITATPYSENDAEGTAGPTVSVTFTVVSSGGTPDGVVDLILINADTDDPIGPLVDGDTIFLSDARELNVEAITSPDSVGGVRFSYDGQLYYRTERNPPYAFAGNRGGKFFGWTPSIGEHTLTATALDDDDNEMGAMTVSFTVVD